MNWADRPYIEYLNAVDNILEHRFGITSDDTGLELIAACQEARQTPGECVDELAAKYRLISITPERKTVTHA